MNSQETKIEERAGGGGWGRSLIRAHASSTLPNRASLRQLRRLQAGKMLAFLFFFSSSALRARVSLSLAYGGSPPSGVKWFSPLLCEAEDYRLIN